MSCILKICNKCSAAKDLDEFSINSGMLDGRLGACKQCCNLYSRNYYVNNLDRCKANIKAYAKTESGRIRMAKAYKKYSKTEAGRIMRAKGAKIYKAKYPLRVIAKNTLNSAVKSGKLICPDKCTSCGNLSKIEAHHEDYTKPLDVVWLCKKCHQSLHNEKRRISA